MAISVFTLRGYTMSMRRTTGAEGRPPFVIEDLPSMEAPSFQWWAGEVVSNVVEASPSPLPLSANLPSPSPPPPPSPLLPPSPSPSPSPPPPPPPSLKRPLGKSTPPKKRAIPYILDAAPLSSDVPGPSGTNKSLELDEEYNEALCTIVVSAREEKKRKRKFQEEGTSAQGSGGRKPEGNFATRKEAHDKPNGLDNEASKEPAHVLGKRKEKIHDMQKSDSVNCIHSNKSKEVEKPQDVDKMTPFHTILKKHTKQTSVKSVKHVKFSYTNDVPANTMQSCELSKLLPDAMASSCQGKKSINQESGSSHSHKEAITQSKEANQNSENDKSHRLPLIDLNQAPPEFTGVENTYDSNSEIPNAVHTQEETSDSGAQVLDGRQNQIYTYVGSHGSRHQPPATDLETFMNSRSTLLYGNATEGSGNDIVRPQLTLRDITATYRPLPDRAIQNRVQQQQNRFLANLNHGGSQRSNLESPSLSGHHNRNVIMEFPQHGHSCTSLHAQSANNVPVNSTSTSHVALTQSANSSQTHYGYKSLHDFDHTLSADQSPYEHNLMGLSYLQTYQHLQLGYPPVVNHVRAAFNPNVLLSWHSDPFTRTEPSTTPYLPSSRQHGTLSSIAHGNCEASSSQQGAQRRSGPMKLTPGARHLLVPSGVAGRNSRPVYSCVSLWTGRGGAWESQNQ